MGPVQDRPDHHQTFARLCYQRRPTATESRGASLWRRGQSVSGRTFASYEIKAFVAELLYRYDLELILVD